MTHLPSESSPPLRSRYGNVVARETSLWPMFEESDATADFLILPNAALFAEPHTRDQRTAIEEAERESDWQWREGTKPLPPPPAPCGTPMLHLAAQ